MKNMRRNLGYAIDAVTTPSFVVAFVLLTWCFIAAVEMSR